VQYFHNDKEGTVNVPRGEAVQKLDEMKQKYIELKEQVNKMNNARGLSTLEYMRLRELKQLKLWYKDKIAAHLQKRRDQ